MKAYSFYFNTSDWLASPSVKMMSKAERGVYINLLALAWENPMQGTLPASAEKVRRLAEMNAKEWAESGETILEKFPLSECGTFRYNPRLREEAAKEQVRSSKARESANKRWQSERNANASNNDAKAMPTQYERNAIVKDSKVKEREKQASKPEEAAPKKNSIEYPADESPIFQRPAFNAYLDKMGYQQVDKTLYLLRILAGAEDRKPATDSNWQKFILRWLDNDRSNGKLLFPDNSSGGRGEVGATRMKGDLNRMIEQQNSQDFL